MNPHDELRRAIDLARSGDRRAAREALGRALTDAHDSARAHLVAACVDSAALSGQRCAAWCERALTLARASEDDRARLAVLDGVALLGARRGWYREARAHMEEALALAPTAERHRALAALLARAWHLDGAADHVRRAIELDHGSVGDCIRAADLDIDRERTDEALDILDRALTRGSPLPHDHAKTLSDVAQREVRAGALDRAAEHLDRALGLDPTVAAAWSLRATLHLWSLDLASASRCAERALALDAKRLDALRVSAGVSVLCEDYARAHALLDGVLAGDGRDAEAWLWRAEALLREDRLAESLAAAQSAGERSPEFTQYVAAQVVRFLAMIHQGTFRHLPRGVLEEVLAALCPDEVLARYVAFPHPPEVDEDPARNARDTARLLERALAALGGNRSFTPTWIDPYAEHPTFHRVALTPPPRTAAKRTLARVTVDDVDTVRAAFEPVIARYARRDEPWLYVGELYLYAGRYPEARAAFQRALAHNPTARWAFIGLGAVDLGEGDARKALATWERGARVSGGEGPTLYVYRGEAQRRLGRFTEAQRDLENACVSRPSRVSAWVNLALVHDAQNDRARFDATVARVRRDAPEMLADAASEAGVTLPEAGEVIAREDARKVLETALVMMRGNRSSAHPTWVTRDGRWRVSPTSPPGRGEAIDHDLLRAAAALVGR